MHQPGCDRLCRLVVRARTPLRNEETLKKLKKHLSKRKESPICNPRPYHGNRQERIPETPIYYNTIFHSNPGIVLRISPWSLRASSVEHTVCLSRQHGSCTFQSLNCLRSYQMCSFSGSQPGPSPPYVSYSQSSLEEIV